MRRLFYRGRHHVHTAPRPDGELLTQSAIAARIRREAREAAYGSVSISVVPDFSPATKQVVRELNMRAYHVECAAVRKASA